MPNLINTLNALDNFQINENQKRTVIDYVKAMEVINLKLNSLAYECNSEFAEHTTARIDKELKQLLKDFRIS